MLKKLSHWLGRLSVGQKLTLIYLLDLTAVIYVSSILVQEKYLAIDFARKELVGTAYTEAVRTNLLPVFAKPADNQAQAALAGLQRLRTQHDASLNSGDSAEQLVRLLSQGGNRTEVQKSALLERARQLLTVVGNQSNLILDPDLDSYYVMSLTVLRFPELLQVLHDTRQFVLARGQKAASQQQTAQLLTLVGRMDAVLQGLESDYEQAWLAGSPQLKTALQPGRQALLEQARLFETAVKASAEAGLSTTQIDALDAYHAGTVLVLSEAWRAGIVELNTLLQARVDGLFSRMWLHLGGALLLLGCILSLVYAVASQIARPLHALAQVADRVRRTADYSHRAQWHSSDEIGQLFNAFNEMLVQLDQHRQTREELIASARAAQAQRELIAAFPIPIVITSVPDHEVLHVNVPGQPWLDGSATDPWRNGLEPGVRSRFFQRLSDFDAVDEFEVRWLSGPVPAWAVLSARRLKFQGRDAVLTAFTPINRLKVMEQRLELWAKVFEASSEGIIIMDEARNIISVNQAFCRSTAYEFHEVLGRDLRLLIATDADRVWAELKDRESWQGEVHMRKLTGEVYPAWLMISAVYKNATSGEVVNYIGTSIDITDRHAKEERIRFLAQHDVLTELPNRALCLQRLSEALTQARASGEKVALLFIDLDRFKWINDTLGHHIGDGLLQTVARRLSRAVRTEDTVCRLGGDEFVIILRQVRDRDELDASVNQRLIPSIRETMQVQGHTLNVSCSVGVALFPDDAQDEAELMRRADAAMYEAKSAGRDTARYFSVETDQRVMARQTMEVQLRQALANDEFSLHFQPRLNARSRRMQGAEALLRWHNPVLGQVPPGQFICLAEETGLIKAIGLWVLREACSQWMAFQQSGLFEAMELSVNLSGAQLADPELLDQLREVLLQTGMPASLLELELTESHLMDNPQAAQFKVAQIKALGVRVAIDDFGTGYSSLSYLKRFPVDRLKIDQSFVRDLSTDADDVAIAQAIITLGHTLNLLVIAEGVETPEQLAFLRKYQCDEMQGYLFGKPVPAEEFGKLLESGRTLAP